jgi:tetratricopeptide (TPR) repeat protein
MKEINDNRLQTFAKVINKGVTAQFNDRYDIAYKHYFESLKHTKGNVEAMATANYYLGLANMGLRKYPDAIKDFEKSISYGVDPMGKIYDLGLAHLYNGNFQEGIKYYKFRYYRQSKDAPQFPKIPIPFIEDNLEGLKGKRVLVLREQGIGDELLFSRVLEKFSKDVVFASIQVMEPLGLLFLNSFKHLENLNFFTNMNLPVEVVNLYDCYVPFGTLFDLYNRDGILEQNTLVPLPNPILKLDKDKMNIGICLSGNSQTRDYQRKMVDYISFINYLSTEAQLEGKDIQFYNLQINEELPNTINIKDMVKDINDTANIIMGLDKVYSTDTAILHLSLLLGKDVTFLHRDYVSWIWNYEFYKNIKDVKL